MKKGESMTELQKQKISNSLLGHVVTSETREKISRSKRGVKRDPAVVENWRRKVTGKRKGVKLSAEHRAKLRDSKKELLADPVKGQLYKEAISKGWGFSESVYTDISIAKRSGENHGMAKLNWTAVDAIRHMKSQGLTNSQILAIVVQVYDVSLSTIKAITSNRLWKEEKRPKN
ncbi:hypothetical protein [Paenibacillus dendritiformis]|uniref:hypothetical protein n=1 Tax=Paenibacillus dendritiformis TaxID=130049 RepID=UPI00387E1941